MEQFLGSEEFDYSEKNKIRAKRRKLNASKAKRKQKISKDVYGFDWYNNLHEYSKNKVHCSCQLCRFKPKWNPDNEPMQDTRHKESMKSKEQDYLHNI